MRAKIALVYNESTRSRYSLLGEDLAETGVLNAVDAVQQALLELGHRVDRVPLELPLESAVSRLEGLEANLVFNLFEGFCGYPETEALVPEICARMNTPFTGCPASALRMALDKAAVKELLQSRGIPTPDYQLLGPETLTSFRLGFPCIVKPRSEDGSHGLSEDSVVYDFDSLRRQVRLISESYGGEALVEEYMEGREFSSTVIGNGDYCALPVSEMVYTLPEGKPRILTFAAKWQVETMYYQATRSVCPASITPEEAKQITGLAEYAFRLLGCRGYARVDMRMDGDGCVNIIEVNPNPDIAPDSGTVRQARAAGMDYRYFIEKVVALALEENGYHAAPDAALR